MSHHSDLIDTTEMYLRTVYELEEEGVTPLRARIAERLRQSGPTVSQTVARMERDGLLTVEGDRHLELTHEGRRQATSVMRKHRLAECLLIDVIGMEWEEVHIEACRWEHVMSDSVERRIADAARQPHVLPARQPDPRSGRAGDPARPVLGRSAGHAGAGRCRRSEKAVVRRISEQIQPDADIMRDLRSSRSPARPTVRLAPEGKGLTLTTDDGTTTVDGTRHATSSSPSSDGGEPRPHSLRRQRTRAALVVLAGVRLTGASPTSVSSRSRV